MMFQKARIQRNRPKKATPRIPTLEEFVKKRDYIGAITLLEFNSSSLNGRNGSIVDNLLWKGYCAFHNGSLSQAQKTYIELLSGDYNDIPEETTLYLACVYYYMQMYEAAVESAEHGPECPLKHRILFHAALRLGDEEEISRRKALLTDETDDELTKAAMLYMTNKFQESNEAYKRCLIKHKDMVALNLYGAMCYFKLVCTMVLIHTVKGPSPILTLCGITFRTTMTFRKMFFPFMNR
jgi:intraflagellar transport protein 56